MKKLLTALAILMMPLIFLTGCGNKKREAVEKQIDVQFTNLKNHNNASDDVKFIGYSDLKLEKALMHDSVLIYSAKADGLSGKTEVKIPVEFVYCELPENGGEILGINLVSTNSKSVMDATKEILDELSKFQSTKKKTAEEASKFEDNIYVMSAMAFLQSPQALTKQIDTK